MHPVGIVLLLLVAFIVVVGIAGYYNHLVMLKHNVREAWSNIDVLLKQRNDELPKLAAVCRRYMAHERQVFERLSTARELVSSARERLDLRSLGTAESAVRAGVRELLSRAEAYPQLKADGMVRDLARRIAELEDAIADRRVFYNESVWLSNTAVEQFPGSVYAQVFGFQSAAFFNFGSPEERRTRA